MESVPPKSISIPVRETLNISETDLNQLYDAVYESVKNLVSGKPVTAASVAVDLQSIILSITNVVQKYSDSQGEGKQLTGPQKQTLAITLFKHAMKKLHDDGLLQDDVYNLISLSADLFGPTLINGVVAIMKKINATAQDIAQHGCTGCCQRNCIIV